MNSARFIPRLVRQLADHAQYLLVSRFEAFQSSITASVQAISDDLGLESIARASADAQLNTALSGKANAVHGHAGISNAGGSVSVGSDGATLEVAGGLSRWLFRRLTSTGTGTARDAASIDAVWTDATDATRTSAVTISTINAGGTLIERMRISGVGETRFTNSSSNPNSRTLSIVNSGGTIARLAFETTNDTSWQMLVGSGLAPSFVLGRANVGDFFIVNGSGSASFSGGLSVAGSFQASGAVNFAATTVSSLRVLASPGTASFVRFTEANVAERGSLGFAAGSSNFQIRVPGTSPADGIEALRLDAADDATRSNLWVRHNAVLKRVEVGAAESGGAGFRTLRIVN